MSAEVQARAFSSDEFGSRSVVSDRAEVRAILEAARRNGLVLTGVRTAAGEAEEARIVHVAENHLDLVLTNTSAQAGTRLRLNLSLDGSTYFFTCRVDRFEGDKAATGIPASLFRSERRDRARVELPTPTFATVAFDADGSVSLAGRVLNRSPNGCELELEGLPPAQEPRWLKFANDPAGRFVQVRHKALVPGQERKTRLGLRLSEVPYGPPAPVTLRNDILDQRPGAALLGNLAIARQSARFVAASVASQILPSRAPHLERVTFENENGEQLVGYLDSAGSGRSKVAVVIPPALGRTKETLLPLARTIVESLAANGVASTVLRFDGTRRRGESYLPPGSGIPGREHTQFSISTAISDLEGAVRYLAAEGLGRVVMVTFSAASIEARRVLARSKESQLGGWVSVVGAADLQSGLRSVLGGFDFLAAKELGAHLGEKELMGVLVDMDLITQDAIDQRLAFLEDARRDMAEIDKPISWIHGQNDAWLDLDRVREIMACGDSSQRRLMSVPTGHQLRSSKEAMQVFQLVAVEIGRIATGSEVRPVAPDMVQLDRRRREERRRRKVAAADTRRLWSNYLMGPDDGLRIDLMNATSAYSDFLELHARDLPLEGGARIADLGAGTGPFSRHLSEQGVDQVTVDEFDFVKKALRASQRSATSSGLQRRQLIADFDRGAIPARSGTYDGVCACLVVSYVRDPEEFLREAHRVLRPGGVLSISGLRPDADVSKLFVDGMEELRGGIILDRFGSQAEAHLQEDAREFLSQAAQVLDFEEQGLFTFWDDTTFAAKLRGAGFHNLEVSLAFGDPPQALIVSAVKR